MSVQLAAQDFSTPDKGGPSGGFALTTMPTTTHKSFKSVTPTDSGSNNTTTAKTTVTPGVMTSAAMNAAAGKHVRFGGATDDTGKEPEAAAVASTASSNGNKRGLVSRRGGRCVTPGRPAAVPSCSTVASADATPMEATFCGKFSDDSVPALCSANSVGIVSLPSECEKDPKVGTPPQRGRTDVQKQLVAFAGNADVCDDSCRPSSISCTGSAMEVTSPRKDALSFDDADSKSYIRSPVPLTALERFAQVKKTPTKCPSNFQSLPSLDDQKLGSPVGFILSPHGPGTPSYKAIRDSFEKETKCGDKEDGETSLSEKFPLTPTNFSVDYGKSSNTCFDTSNVLNWLQSPTANGFFSPGGLNSIMNTPKGSLVPRTPGTPTVTSFFFSDVASLARNGDTPKRDSETGRSPKKGLSNIICISPLASTRHRGTANATNTPINYNDIFASPNPLLDDSPIKGELSKQLVDGKLKGSDPSLDALHLAERDLRQDEDLSVLLQLAGGNTPRGAADRSTTGKGPVGHVFRSSGSRKGDDPNDRENLPGLQLPIIGDREGDSSSTRLTRKSSSRDPSDKDSFKPSIGIRKSFSSARDREMFGQAENGSTSSYEHPGAVLSSDEPQPNQATSNITCNKPLSSGPHPYSTHSHPFPPRPPSSDMYGGYASMPPHGMRSTGRMSVVVGGPPPSSRGPKTNPPPRSHITPAHRRPSYSSHDAYPPQGPPGMSYPTPPHSHYPLHPGMSGHPYHSHYAPPPRHHAPPPAPHLPLYGALPHPASKATPGKKVKQPTKIATKPQATPLKRPSVGSDPGKPTKKAKKAPAKKKNKSPQLTEKADLQKAAQTIAAVNAASGGKNDKAAALAAAILRGVTMRPSGKWQAQLYFAGKSRYIGVFDTREKAALAYEIAREKLKSEKQQADGALSPKQTENAVNAARKAAFDGVNEQDPRAQVK